MASTENTKLAIDKKVLLYSLKHAYASLCLPLFSSNSMLHLLLYQSYFPIVNKSWIAALTMGIMVRLADFSS